MTNASDGDPGRRREVTINTCAKDSTDATTIASAAVSAPTGLRIARIAVDLTTTATDLWAAFLALYPSNRIRVSDLDSSIFGGTSLDSWVQGWTLQAGESGHVFVLDCARAS
jgi:hypothetical protein